jgi:hypothetical protein
VIQGTIHVLVARLTDAGLHKLEELSRHLKKKHECQVRFVAIVDRGSDSSDLPDITLLHDAAGAFAAAYGANEEFVFLVRPDGYLAYVGNALNSEDIEEALARSLAASAAIAE